MKRLGRWLFNGLAVLSLLLCLATPVIWVRSYWRYEIVRWSSDRHNQKNYILFHWSVSSLRGGYAVYISHNHASDAATIGELQDYFTWHPHGFEISSERVSDLDLDAAINSSWRTSYLFKPTSPTFLGAQAGSTRGRYHGNNFWTIELSIPYWMPAGIFTILPIWSALEWWKRRRRPKHNFCSACGYDLRATPDRCPECGATPSKKDN